MDPLVISFILVPLLFIVVLFGFHIAFALAGLSILGIILMTGSFSTGLFMLSSTCFEAIRGYIFATIQLFVLMGALMSNSGSAKGIFKLANILLRKVPGGLGIANVFANAVFAAVTGVSIASVAVFSQIAVPEMIANKYNRRFATGSVAGSAVLGMLIPPSLLLVVYGMLAQQSIGKMFVAGIIPGIILALMFSLGIVLLAILKPSEIFEINMDKKNELSRLHNESTENVNLFGTDFALIAGKLNSVTTDVIGSVSAVGSTIKFQPGQVLVASFDGGDEDENHNLIFDVNFKWRQINDFAADDSTAINKEPRE